MIRDYDSMIAFIYTILVTRDIYLYPISNLIETLRKSIHIKVPMVIKDGQMNVTLSLLHMSNILIVCHQGPYACIASLSPKHLL